MSTNNTKLIIFDLDGVLVEAKRIHYEALNEALEEVGEEYVISWHDHLRLFDGHSTYDKLGKLTDDRGLPFKLHTGIWMRKQQITGDMLGRLPENPTLCDTLHRLRDAGYRIGCCSNSIRRSVIQMLTKIGVMEYMDFTLSNEDVRNPKPHPEIYWKGMSLMNVLPEETVIVEDSPTGLLAAGRSRAHVIRVASPTDVTVEKIMSELDPDTPTSPKWKDEKLNVLIPMAGAGSRFAEQGYTFPKPLIDVEGKPMIQAVVDNLNMDARFIFIVQREHAEKYNLDTTLNLIAPGCTIVKIDGVTEGAACTTLLAREHFDNDRPLVIANSDQLVEWDSNEFMYKCAETGVDASILTFKATHPKWSYAKVGDDGMVTEVAEKNPISDNATVGIYYWKTGRDYVINAEQMIERDIRTNGEFYVCPVYNEAIDNGLGVSTFEIEKMWGVGTPEDLTNYLNR